MITVDASPVATANGRQQTYSLRADQGYALLPGQLVSLDAIQINGADRSLGSVIQQDGEITFRKTQNLVDARLPALFREIINPLKGDVITWSGTYLTVAELYGDTAQYLDLITHEHATRPRFNALVASTAQNANDHRAYYNRLQTTFDVDTAVGAQLDAIGLWVGLSRRVKVPIVDVFFAWDDAANPTKTGWNYGIWVGRYESRLKVELLPDDVFRRMIRAKIKANQWDGSREGLYRIFEIGFGGQGLTLAIIDNQDMTFTLQINGTASAIDKALIISGYLPIRPAGVAITDFVFDNQD